MATKTKISQEVISTEQLIDNIGKDISRVLTHRSDRVGKYGMRDDVDFEINKSLFKRDKLQVVGAYKYQEKQIPYPHEDYQHQREWMERVWKDNPNRVPSLKRLDAEENAPVSRTVTFRGKPSTGEHFTITLDEGEVKPSRIELSYKDTTITLFRVKPTETWKKIENRTGAMGAKSTNISDPDLRIIVTRMGTLINALDIPLDKAITESEVRHLESRIRVADQMLRSATFLNEGRGIANQNRPNHLSPGEVDRRVRQGFEESDKVGTYEELIIQTKKGLRKD